MSRSAGAQGRLYMQVLCSFGAHLLPARSSFMEFWAAGRLCFLTEGIVIQAPRSVVDRKWGRLSHSQSLSKHCWNHSLGR